MAKCGFCLSIQLKYDDNISKDLCIEIYLKEMHSLLKDSSLQCFYVILWTSFCFTINLFNHIEIIIYNKYIKKKFKTYCLLYSNSKNHQTTFDKQALQKLVLIIYIYIIYVIRSCRHVVIVSSISRTYNCSRSSSLLSTIRGDSSTTTSSTTTL